MCRARATSAAWHFSTYNAVNDMHLRACQKQKIAELINIKQQPLFAYSTVYVYMGAILYNLSHSCFSLFCSEAFHQIIIIHARISTYLLHIYTMNYNSQIVKWLFSTHFAIVFKKPAFIQCKLTLKSSRFVNAKVRTFYENNSFHFFFFEITGNEWSLFYK